MTVAVTPETFTLVLYDAGRIAEIVGEIAGLFGLPDDLVIAVDVDESTPLARAALSAVDPPTLSVEGGAFESARFPRHLNEGAVAVVAARLLGRVSDRREAPFATAPPEDALTIAQSDAWDAYCLGRASRQGVEVYQPRWRYRFRTRHGFTDVADGVFDRLWAADGLGWADLDEACRQTQRAREAQAASAG